MYNRYITPSIRFRSDRKPDSMAKVAFCKVNCYTDPDEKKNKPVIMN